MPDRAVKVFISYSWGEGESYRDWVKRLVARLRSDGIDATCDAWKPEGRTIPEYMNSEIRNSDRVLVLCSPTLRTSVHQTEDGKGETGVGWESALLTGTMFAGIPNAKQKVVPVLTTGDWKESAPDFLLGMEWIDLRTTPETFERKYPALLKRILGKKEPLPPLGPLPDIPDSPPVQALRGSGPVTGKERAFRGTSAIAYVRLVLLLVVVSAIAVTIVKVWSTIDRFSSDPSGIAPAPTAAPR